MKTGFADRLLSAVRRKNTCACVGIDPVWEKLPESIWSKFPDAPSDPLSACAGMVAFGRGVIDAVSPHVGVVKINIAFFEPLGGIGFGAYFELVRYARQAGLLVIGDVKRADIGHSSTAYASAHLGQINSPDAITVNPYFGTDGVAPFVEFAQRTKRGVFVLVHTSNPSAGEVQHFGSEDGDVALTVAQWVDRWGSVADLIGECGYSLVGAVVAPGDPMRAAALRGAMPRAVFLVPGFGAQGRSIDQIAPCFNSDGNGAIVNSSRGVIYAFESDAYRDAGASDWRMAVSAACRDFVMRLNEASRRHGCG